MHRLRESHPNYNAGGVCYALAVESASHPRSDAHVGRTALLIAAATMVVHGALIFNDGVYLGTVISSTRGFSSATGPASGPPSLTRVRPARAVIHVALGHLPHFVVAYKVSAFVAILRAGDGCGGG